MTTVQLKNAKDIRSTHTLDRRISNHICSKKVVHDRNKNYSEVKTATQAAGPPPLTPKIKEINKQIFVLFLQLLPIKQL